MSQETYIRTALRVPQDLHKAIHQAADEAGHSFNAEIIGRLQQSFKPPSAVDVHLVVDKYAEENGVTYAQALDLILMRGVASDAPAAYLVEVRPGMSVTDVQRAIRAIGEHAPADAALILQTR